MAIGRSIKHIVNRRQRNVGMHLTRGGASLGNGHMLGTTGKKPLGQSESLSRRAKPRSLQKRGERNILTAKLSLFAIHSCIMLPSSVENQVAEHTGSNWGKIVGSLLGFCLSGSPWGALFGFMIGRVYDQQQAGGTFAPSDFWENNKDFAARRVQAVFTMGVVVLSAKMARSDGRVSRAEIDAFKRVFNVTPAKERAIAALFNEARSSAAGFEPYAKSLAHVFHNNPHVLEEILTGLFIIGAADSAGLSAAEIAFLKKVSFLFGFKTEDFARIAARSGVALPVQEKPRRTAAEAYLLLGIEETATPEEIKIIYRSLIREHHPDKLMAQGVPPEFITTATEKMKRINVAYDSIKKERGIK